MGVVVVLLRCIPIGSYGSYYKIIKMARDFRVVSNLNFLNSWSAWALMITTMNGD